MPLTETNIKHAIQIRGIAEEYFKNHPNVAFLDSGRLMKYLVEEGVFPIMHYSGAPLKGFLSFLEQKEGLYLIPFAHCAKGRWIFTRPELNFESKTHSK